MLKTYTSACHPFARYVPVEWSQPVVAETVNGLMAGPLAEAKTEGSHGTSLQSAFLQD